MPEITPGQCAYEVYCTGLTWRLPWHDVPERWQQRWETAAQAVLEAFVSSARPVTLHLDEETA